MATLQSAAGIALVTPTDLSLRANRERLSRSAIKGFFRIIGRWGLTTEQACELIGGGSMSVSTYFAVKANPDDVKPLTEDQLARVSFLVGIYKALHILYNEDLADAWMKLPNKNPMFEGNTPLDYVQHGGILALYHVRGLLDARRAGQ